MSQAPGVARSVHPATPPSSDGPDRPDGPDGPDGAAAPAGTTGPGGATGRRLRVAVVDNFDYVRDGVLADLRARPDTFVEPTAHETVEAVLELPHPPDVVVLDLHLGRDDTPSTPLVPALVARGSTVVLFTSEERPAPLRAAVRAGVAGLALKNDGREAMLELVLRAADGEFDCSSVLARALVTDPQIAPHLTERQVEVLTNLNDGLTRQQVGRRLGITVDTVGDHLKDVRKKYADLDRDVTNTGSLLREAGADGFLDPPARS